LPTESASQEILRVTLRRKLTAALLTVVEKHFIVMSLEEGTSSGASLLPFNGPLDMRNQNLHRSFKAMEERKLPGTPQPSTKKEYTDTPRPSRHHRRTPEPNVKVEVIDVVSGSFASIAATKDVSTRQSSIASNDTIGAFLKEENQQLVQEFRNGIAKDEGLQVYRHLDQLQEAQENDFKSSLRQGGAVRGQFGHPQARSTQRGSETLAQPQTDAARCRVD